MSECTGAAVDTLYSMQTVSRADFDAGETYLDAYKKFDNVISTAISSGYIERKLEHNGKSGLFYCTTETEISVD